jgi:hypothetical protein
MHKKSIAIYVYNDNRVDLAHGWFTDKSRDIDTTQLKFGMSFQQVVSIKERLPTHGWRLWLGQTILTVCSLYLGEGTWL